MPIISRIGRRSVAARAWLGAFYAILVAGAVTMIYPFLLMLATSFTGPADSDQFQLFPRYLYDTQALFIRVISEKYLGGDTVADVYGIDGERVPEMKILALPQWRAVLGDKFGWDIATAEPRRIRMLREYEAFLQTAVPQQLLQVGFEREVGVPRLAERMYWRFLQGKFGGDLAAMNKAYGETRESFSLARFPLERVMYRAWTPPDTVRFRDFLVFKQEVRSEHPEMMQLLNGDMAWRRHLQNAYGNNINLLNNAWGSAFDSFAQLKLPTSQSDAAQQGRSGAPAADWDDFVRRKWSPRHVIWGERNERLWREYLQNRYERLAPRDALAALNAAHRTSYRSFTEVPIPLESAFHGAVSSDFFGFVRGAGNVPRADPAGVVLQTVNQLYREHLRDTFKSIEAANAAYGTAAAAWSDFVVPTVEYDWWVVNRDQGAWRWYLLTNNYRLVFDLLLLRGNSLVNTIAFITLTVVIQLTVNPMCAYALSRFNLAYGEKIMVFLLATMAFPAEVTMIPGFLLLRDLNLLNTFAALLLPSAAQGFSIFILKGFFDALPRDVFEAAKLDGCGEWRTFFHVLVPLSTPVLAYVALLGFTAAYTSFLFALVICQDSRMWTMMVWIYQLQGSVHESAQIAALIVVMIPTLLVFAFSQRMIMRGVVLPQVD